ncbi:MAG TPA: retropepsin-like aspartic protease [Sphingomonas sp.]|jgi:aspartyl protease family protein|uniref:retropepsin-like aspartic protease family protein n=1 Tax=Sphingomonas sp. TaxID=28214 RepID=UPI002ED9A6D4
MLSLIPATMLIGAARANRDSLFEGPVPDPIANAVMPAASPAIAGGAASASGQDVARGTDGLFYVTARVNGRPLRFLVDTGASFVVLTAADAQAVGVQPEERHYNGRVETVGGSTAMAWTTLDHVHVAGHDIHKLRAVVVRGGLGVSLMGQNMLAELDSVTFQADRLSLR